MHILQTDGKHRAVNTHQWAFWWFPLAAEISDGQKNEVFSRGLSSAHKGSCAHPFRLHRRPKINTVIYISSIYSPSLSPLPFALSASQHSLAHSTGFCYFTPQKNLISCTSSDRVHSYNTEHETFPLKHTRCPLLCITAVNSCLTDTDPGHGCGTCHLATAGRVYVLCTSKSDQRKARK